MSSRHSSDSDDSEKNDRFSASKSKSFSGSMSSSLSRPMSSFSRSGKDTFGDIDSYDSANVSCCFFSLQNKQPLINRKLFRQLNALSY